MTRNRRIFFEKWNSQDSGERRLQLQLLNLIDNAKRLHQSDQTDKAIDLLLEGLKFSSTRLDLYIALAEILIEAKHPEKALEVLEQAPGSLSDLSVLELICMCKESLNLMEEAEDIAQRLLDSDPASAFAMNMKGMIAYKKGERHFAKECFERAIACDPSFGEPYTNLGVMYWTEGRQDQALKHLERGFVLSPTFMDMATSYLSAATEMGQFSRAETSIRDALVLHPFNKRLQAMLIEVLLHMGKHSEAMDAIEDLIVRHGHDEDLIEAALAVREKVGPLKENAEPHRAGTLSVCMIVKDEEESLAKCLSSIKPVADEMIVVDTGSQDRTKDIATIFGAKVHDFQWTSDFAKARNFSLSKASCHWILVLDADEVISRRDHERLLRITGKKKKNQAYYLITRNYVENATLAGWQANQGEYPEEEQGGGWIPSNKVRLFPNDHRIRFHHKVHELVEPSIESLGIQVSQCVIPVHHYGKLNRQRASAKDETYYNLGLEKLENNKNDPKALTELAKAAAELERHQEAANLWKEVINLNPSDALAHFGIGSAHLHNGNFVEAMSACETAMTLDEDMKEAAYNYSLCALYTGENLEKAIDSLELLLKKNPDYPPALGMLGTLCIMSGQKERGLAHIQRIKQLGFSGSDCFYQNARRLMERERPDEALRLMETAVETGNADERILALLARVYRDSGLAAGLGIQTVN